MGKRLITQRRGRGGSQYRSPSHRHVDDVRLPAKDEGLGIIKDLIHAPGRTSPLAVIDFNGEIDYQIAAEGVKVGQKVAKGEQIAKMGSTGNSSGPHVHFEVHVNGRYVNPWKYIK